MYSFHYIILKFNVFRNLVCSPCLSILKKNTSYSIELVWSSKESLSLRKFRANWINSSTNSINKRLTQDCYILEYNSDTAKLQ